MPTKEPAVILEVLIRGMNAGGSLLLAGVLLGCWPANWRRGLGALFAVAAGCYALVSSPEIGAAIGPARLLPSWTVHAFNVGEARFNAFG